mmetsp:Transcript_10922/g.36468  ORF Transcript_10922/g.36468 Transcript_10922/m.36468 type:complete len:322 (-) Transcript_10922:354-1319(-)
MLPRPRESARLLDAPPSDVEGLHLLAQAKRVPVAPYHRFSRVAASGDSDPHGQYAPRRRVRGRRSLGVQRQVRLFTLAPDHPRVARPSRLFECVYAARSKRVVGDASFLLRAARPHPQPRKGRRLSGRHYADRRGGDWGESRCCEWRCGRRRARTPKRRYRLFPRNSAGARGFGRRGRRVGFHGGVGEMRGLPASAWRPPGRLRGARPHGAALFRAPQVCRVRHSEETCGAARRARDRRRDVRGLRRRAAASRCTSAGPRHPVDGRPDFIWLPDDVCGLLPRPHEDAFGHFLGGVGGEYRQCDERNSGAPGAGGLSVHCSC